MLSIPTRAPGTPDPAGDINAIVIEVNRIGGITAPTFNVKSYGAVGDGVANDTTAITSALNAASVNGGEVYFPPGTYSTLGGHTIPNRVSIVGCDNSPRYGNYAIAPPLSPCSIVMRTGTTNSFMFKAATTMRNAGIYNITLSGNNETRPGPLPVNCLDFTAAPNEQSFNLHRFSINNFSGDGIVGRLSVFHARDGMLWGNRGWGAQTSTNFWTDTIFDTVLIAGNVLGGINVDGTTQSGLVQWNNCRFERSGWDPANNKALPGVTGSPGVRLRNIRLSMFAGCTTDANSGNGIDIRRFDATTSKNVFGISFVGCSFNRDGYGPYLDGSNAEIPASSSEFACVWIDGESASSTVNTITFSACTIAYGKPRDDSVGTQLYPKYGIKLDWAFYLSWLGGTIGVGDPTRNIVATNFWRPVFLLTEQVHSLPAFPTTGRPTFVPPMSMWFNSTTSALEYTIDGVNVRSVTSTSAGVL